jgi:hypothetical protein
MTWGPTQERFISYSQQLKVIRSCSKSSFKKSNFDFSLKCTSGPNHKCLGEPYPTKKTTTRGLSLPWAAHQKQLLFSDGNYQLSIFSNIKFELRICLNNNLKKCHDLGLSFNRANQINMWANLIKDYPVCYKIWWSSINYFKRKCHVQRFFFF